MKLEIIQSLQWLKQRKFISVYAYVIMPNHIHLIWELPTPNDRKSAKGSLLKFTAHRFHTSLYEQNPELLKQYEVAAKLKRRRCVLHPNTYWYSVPWRSFGFVRHEAGRRKLIA